MKKEKLEAENIALENQCEQAEVSKDDACECPACQKESVKVMDRYATAPSVSHLFVLIVSLLFIAAIITPNIAYLYNGGFAAENIIEANQFVFRFLDQMNWNVLGIPASQRFIDFQTSFIAPSINPLLGAAMDYELVPFIVTCCLGVGLIASLVCAIYSFICVVGGIGRKHAVRLSYVLLVAGFIAFFPAFYMCGVSIHNYFVLQTTIPMVWPLIPGIGFILAIILVITCHVTYAKHIKHTITAKQAAALETCSDDTLDDVEEKVEEAPAPVIEEVKEEAPIIVEEKVEEVTEVKEESPAVEEKVEEKPAPVVEEVKETPIEEKPARPMTQTVKIPVITDIDLTRGLPSGITELGDHQFSKNLEIEIADIPEGIDKIGPACFANCLNLKIVNLPKSLAKISFNAFFACKKLTKINYAGTKVEWKKIVRGSNWLTSAGTKVVICSDGAISVNPFH